MSENGNNITEKIHMEIMDQISLLRDRGLIIEEQFEDEIIDIINKENYYNLINGYKQLFIDIEKTTNHDEKYKENANFYEIYALYLFDRNIRSLFLKYFLIIENNLKSLIARTFSSNYGHKDYLKLNNFSTKNMNPKKRNSINKFISNLKNDISVQFKRNNPMITHHKNKYNNIPPWVLVNIITMGKLSIFYSFMKEKDQNEISKEFLVSRKDFKTYIFSLQDGRNKCAHDERFFDYRSYKKGRKRLISDLKYHDDLNIQKDSHGNYIKGKNDLFSSVLILKKLLNEKNFEDFIDNLIFEVSILENKIKTIGIKDVYEVMGFPYNWKEIKSLEK